jgi:hypothetical protein
MNPHTHVAIVTTIESDVKTSICREEQLDRNRAKAKRELRQGKTSQ